MRRSTLPLALLALAVSAGTLAAQSGQRTTDRAPNRAAVRATDGVRPAALRNARRASNPAASLLRLQTQLLLTETQVTQLTALSTAQSAVLKTDRAARVSDAQRQRADLRDARSGGDPETIRAALDAISETRNASRVEGMDARKAAMELLTPEQRTKAVRVATRVAQNARADSPRRDGRLMRDRGRNGTR